MSEDKMEIILEDKKEIMSGQRAVTPDLQRYLDENDLSQYSNDFIRLGYLSTNKICCLPQEMDANFVEELNINSNVHCLKARTMLNEIRREDANTALSKMFNVTNTNNINDNKTDVIDLISPEPIEENNENDMNGNINENVIINEIISTDQHKKYFLELLSKYGTKMNYDIDEKVRFFIPDFIPEKYIDRIGIIKSKISDMEYKIIDEKSEISYNVPLESILKFNENNNNNINNNIYNNESNKMNTNINCAIESDIDTECGICYQQMQKVKAKNIYENAFTCDGNKCNKQLKGNDIVYHCNNINWHKCTYDLCCYCIKKNNKYKPIIHASSTIRNPMPLNSWEEKFIVNCNKEYKNRCNVTQTQKFIEISCKLCTYTSLIKENNERDAPWRATRSVASFINNKVYSKTDSSNHKKRKTYNTRSSNSPLKKRRTS